MLGVAEEVGGTFLAGTKRDSGLEPVVERGRLEGETIRVGGEGEPEPAKNASEGPLAPRPVGPVTEPPRMTLWKVTAVVPRSQVLFARMLTYDPLPSRSVLAWLSCD